MPPTSRFSYKLLPQLTSNSLRTSPPLASIRHFHATNTMTVKVYFDCKWTGPEVTVDSNGKVTNIDRSGDKRTYQNNAHKDVKIQHASIPNTHQRPSVTRAIHSMRRHSNTPRCRYLSESVLLKNSEPHLPVAGSISSTQSSDVIFSYLSFNARIAR